MKAKQNLMYMVLAVGVTVTVAGGAISLLVPARPAIAGEPAATETGQKESSYEAHDDVLKRFVNANGMVNYRALKADRRRLDAFVLAVGASDARKYEDWKEEDRIAFWINAYNALTLKVIIDHYPIKASFFASLRFPKNSIRQISGVWDKLKFVVMGKKVTLEYIEHEVLRKKFNEPRIHMALVCAAMGCPPLRNEPYIGKQLEAQLKDQTKRFLKNAKKFRIDRRKEVVYLSPIFKWFGSDFVRTYGTNEKFTNRKPEERAVLNYISQHLSEDDRGYLAGEKYKVEYVDYDWSLNEQPPVPTRKTNKRAGTKKR